MHRPRNPEATSFAGTSMVKASWPSIRRADYRLKTFRYGGLQRYQSLRSALIERAQTGAFNRADMDKDIIPAIRRLNEAKALLVVEPPHSSLGHKMSFCSRRALDGGAARSALRRVLSIWRMVLKRARLSRRSGPIVRPSVDNAYGPRPKQRQGLLVRQQGNSGGIRGDPNPEDRTHQLAGIAQWSARRSQAPKGADVSLRRQRNYLVQP
jgi:hypothetical protein